MSRFAVPEVIDTDRLRLRLFRDPDWRDLHVYCSDEQATRHTYGRALSEGETWRTMAGMIGHWYIRGYGPYALEETATGRVLGTVGFWYPNDWPEPEIKWALARPYWGRGFASEAARAVQAAGKHHLPEVRLISFIHRDNAASIRLAESVGARFEDERAFRDAFYRVYRHP